MSASVASTFVGSSNVAAGLATCIANGADKLGIVSAAANLVSEKGNIVSAAANLVTEKGNLISEVGNLNGSIIVTAGSAAGASVDSDE